jgi:hypothetical protein
MNPSEWIAVSKQLPPPDVLVCVMFQNEQDHRIGVGRRYLVKDEPNSAWLCTVLFPEEDLSSYQLSHWCRLPDFPQT